jgi:hypothetical protein
MLKWLTGGVIGSVENIAKEWIDTDKEKAEAKAIMVKTLDPNGLMRRQISLTVSRLYSIYILLALVLLLLQAFDLTPTIIKDGVEYKAVDNAIVTIKELFTPITTLFGAVVTASFGVNGINSYKK